MSARLAEVLRKATHDLGYCSHGGDAEHLAAAVVAHLASPEVVERAAKALADDEGMMWSAIWQEDNRFNRRARAALAAAVGGDGTEGR